MGIPILRIVSGTNRLATENEINNPQLATAISPWTTGGTNTIARSNAQSKLGNYSLQCTYQNSNTLASYPLTTLSVSTTYILSVYIYAPSDWDGSAFVLSATGFTGATITGLATWATGETDKWVRISTKLDIAADVSGSIVVTGSGQSADKFMFVDGLQVEPSNYITPYCDGTLPGCVWTGTAHDSNSIRLASEREEISLLGNYFYLNSVRPQTAQYKDGGTFSSSPFADGRRLVDTKFDNVVETYDLKIVNEDQDAISRTVQDMRRLLIKAADYWTTGWQDEPVWIEAKGANETSSRYALVVMGVVPEDGSHWATPFIQPLGDAVMDNINLIVERGHWLANEPGVGSPTLISAVESYDEYVDTAEAFVPLISTDDADVDNFTSVIDLTGTMELGWNGSDVDDVGIRFRGVNIPKDAVITEAFMRLRATSSLAGNMTDLSIFAEDTSSPAVFSTFGDFQSRIGGSVTTAVDWDLATDWVADTAYDTPSLITPIQEIVNRSDWVSGGDILLFIHAFNLIENNSRDMYSQNTGGNSRMPRLYINWTPRSGNAGNVDSGSIREATVRNEVFVANKQNMAQITHVLVSDGGIVGGNLIGATLPQDLLPVTPALNDAIYFGIDTSLADSGPFNSLIFDISIPAIYGGSAAIIWEDYNSGWATIANVQDGTDDGDGPFSLGGVSSVKWPMPSDIIAAPVNGVTAYWVRARVSDAGTGITPPTQQNRDIYTVTWPYVEVQSTAIEGDIKALAKWSVRGTGDAAGLRPDRVIAGTRLVGRGEDFTMFLNASDEQNPTGITVADTGGTFTSTPQSPTGRSVNIGPAIIGANTEIFTITIDSSLAAQYRGRFRLFVRADYAVPSFTNMNIRARITTGSGGTVITTAQRAPFPAPVAASEIVVDLGVINLLEKNIANDEIEIAIDAGGNSVAGTLAFYDICLMPVDEWSFESFSSNHKDGARVNTGKLLRANGLDSFDGDRGFLLDSATEQIVASYVTLQENIPVILGNKRLRIYFFVIEWDTVTVGDWLSYIETVLSVQLETSARYLSLRGDR